MFDAFGVSDRDQAFLDLLPVFTFTDELHARLGAEHRSLQGRRALFGDDLDDGLVFG